MNTITTRKEGKNLNITVRGDFNLRTKKLILSRINPAVNMLIVNLMDCERMDSEGVIFLHRWLEKGNRLQLIEPPAIFFEILELLDLDRSWDLDKIIAD